MNNEDFSSKDSTYMISLFLLGSSIILSTADQAHSNAWLAIILSVFVSLPIVWIHIGLIHSFPGKDLYDIIDFSFGKFLSPIIQSLYIFFCFFLAALILRAFGDFIKVVGLPRTPLMVSLIVIGLLCIWVVHEGIEVLGRMCALFFILMVCAILLLFILSIPNIEIRHFYKAFDFNKQDILHGTFEGAMFPFTQTIILTTVFSSINTDRSIYKIYFKGFFITAIILYAYTLTNTAVLGLYDAFSSYFPGYITVRRISLGAAFERIEVLLAGTFLIGGFFKISICLFGACNGMAKLFKFKDYKFLAVPIGLSLINLSYFIHDSIMDKSSFATKGYPYFALPFQVILPIIIFVVAKFKTRIAKKNCP